MKSHGAQLEAQLLVQIAGSPAQAPVESQNSVATSQADEKAVHADRGKPEKTSKEALPPAEAILLSSATDTVAQLATEPVLSSAHGSSETMGTLPAAAKKMEMGSDKIPSYLEHAATPGELTAHPLVMQPPGDSLSHTAAQARPPAGAPALDSAAPDGEANLSGNFAYALNRLVENENTSGQIQATVSGRAIAEAATSAPRHAAPTMAIDMRQLADVGAVSLSANAAVENASNVVHSGSFAAAHESAVQDLKGGKDISSAPAPTTHSADVHAAPGEVTAAKPADYFVAPVAGFPSQVSPINIGRTATAQDAPSHTNPHMLLDENLLASAASWHVSANRLEAGVALHGKEWITVEASRQGGVIKAALSAGASSEHRALETMLSGLSAHLEERQVRVGSLAMLAKYGQPSGSMDGADSNGGTGAPPNQQSFRETRTAQRRNETTRASAIEDALDNTPTLGGQVAVAGQRHRISYQA
jgi:hypothetical protein